jgi:hypothetical protein
MRRYGFDYGRELRMNWRVNRPMSDLGARRVFTEKVVAVPVVRRSDRSRNKSAAAVRADVFEDIIDTRSTKRTLVGADARFKRVRRQRLVAVLTGRSQFKHTVCLSCPLTIEMTWYEAKLLFGIAQRRIPK